MRPDGFGVAAKHTLCEPGGGSGAWQWQWQGQVLRERRPELQWDALTEQMALKEMWNPELESELESK